MKRRVRLIFTVGSRRNAAPAAEPPDPQSATSWEAFALPKKSPLLPDRVNVWQGIGQRKFRLDIIVIIGWRGGGQGDGGITPQSQGVPAKIRQRVRAVTVVSYEAKNRYDRGPTFGRGHGGKKNVHTDTFSYNFYQF